MIAATDNPKETRGNLDQVFRALSRAERRRVLVAIMKDSPRRQDEFETVEFRPEEIERETIATELHHNHLPHLGEAGFIDWNRESGQVTRGENFEDVRPLLELLDDHQDDLPDDWP